jgi:hypothetical protein
MLQNVNIQHLQLQKRKTKELEDVYIVVEYWKIKNKGM